MSSPDYEVAVKGQDASLAPRESGRLHFFATWRPVRNRASGRLQTGLRSRLADSTRIQAKALGARQTRGPRTARKSKGWGQQCRAGQLTGCRSGLHGDELHGKEECRAARDRPFACGAVAKIIRDREFDLVTDTSEGKTFLPPFDDLAESE